MSPFTRFMLLIALLGLSMCYSGCATAPEPYDYQPANEMKPGPGLFSGKDGVFSLYETPKTKDVDPEQE